MFISAPDFDLAVGLSQITAATAAWGSSNGNGGGLTFPSPAARAEFDRRCKLRTSDEPGGSRVPRRLPGGGPDFTINLAVARAAADSAFTDLMREDIERFWIYSEQAGIANDAVAFAWKCRENSALAPVSAAAVGALARGCFSVLMEVFRRYPGDGAEDELPAWFESARGLSRCFDRIGIWPLLADEIATCNEMQRGIRAMAQYLDLHIGSEYSVYLGNEPQAGAYIQFIHWVLNLESVEFHRFNGPDEFPDPGRSPQLAVIIADLESLPAPRPPAGYMDEAESGDEVPSLNTLFRALLGSPLGGELDDHGLELMLFAATCQVSAEYRLLQGFPWFSWQRPYSYKRDAQQKAVEGLVKAAIAWLGGNLPGYAFSPKIEQDILSSA